MGIDMFRIDPRRFKEARKQAGLSQEALAEAAEVHPRTIQTIESSGRIRTELLNALASLMSTSVESLLASGEEPWVLPYRRWDPEIMAPGALLAADLGVVGFHGRHNELAELHSWCGVIAGRASSSDSVSPLALRLYFGAGGMGKTRLAIELCNTLLTLGWRAGFLDYDRFHSDDVHWAEILRPGPPLLLVLDYVENHREQLAWLIKKCIASRECRIRFLMLARTPGEWYEQLKTDRGVGDLLRGSASSMHRLGPVSLSAEERDRSWRGAAEAFSKVLGRPVPSCPSHALNARCFDRVLLLHMNALMAVLGEHADCEDGVLDYFVTREKRFWEAMLLERGLQLSLLEGLGQAMALVTLNQGIEESSAAMKLLRLVPLLEDQPVHVLNAISNLLSDCYPGDKWIHGVEPDLLGEHLFERYLKDPKLLQRLKQALKKK